MDYTGRIITKNPQTPSANGAPGIWTLDEALQYSKQGKWPPGYQISRSVRLRSSASAYFNRTPASASNRRTWTWSGWVKLGSLSTTLNILYAYSADSDSGLCQLSYQSNQLRIQGYSASFLMVSTPVYRDPSAWYHIVYKVDTTQATAADRVRVYVNGVEITAWATNTPPPQNTDTAVNNNVAHNIGRNTRNSNDYLDGYFAEVNLIDGQALTPTSFGYFDTYTGVWQPAPYTGTYGTNGFYLTFADNSNNTATTIGKDYSGNGNNWTPNNISVTAGATYDSMVDVPINWGADTGAGGELRGNYCTLNPVMAASIGSSSTILTMSDGNLFVRSTTPSNGIALGTFQMTSGKWYFEFVLSEKVTYDAYLGITEVSKTKFTYNPPDYAYASTGSKYILNSSSSYGASWGVGDVIGVAFDATNGTLTFYKNNVSQGVASSSISSGIYAAAIHMDNNNTQVAGNFNFGQRAFAYTAPSGYKALCTQNISVPTILNGANYMAATLYTGTGGTLAISNGANNTIGTTFQPDLVWVKSRSAATDHKLTDSVRGTTKALISNTTGAETTDTNGLTAFGTGGFTLGSDTVYNNSGATYVGWNWKGGGTAVTNTSGTVNSSVSANTTAGFSVVTFTAPTSGNFSAGHGLGVTPGLVITKVRGRATSWITWHSQLNSGSPGTSYYVELNTTAAQASFAAVWGSTGVTSSVIGMGVGASCAASDTIVAYCFAPISGYSAFGSYTGNGSTDGPFVYCGFRPRWLLLKRTNDLDSWIIEDSSRDSYNVDTKYLQTNAADAEGSTDLRDLLSNGFKPRSAAQNISGSTYIYAAFAENPFTIARAR